MSHTNEIRFCPNCGEEILAKANKCKHCKQWSDATPSPSSENAPPPSSSSEQRSAPAQKDVPNDARQSVTVAGIDETPQPYLNIGLVIGITPILAMIWLACLGYTKNDIWSSDFVSINRDYAVYSTGLCAAVFIAATMASRRLAGAMYVIPFLALAWDANLGGNARVWLVLDGLAIVAVADIATRYQPKAWQLLRVVPVGLGIGWVKAITLMEFAEGAVVDKVGSAMGKTLWKEEIASKLSGDLWGAAFLQALWLVLVVIVLILATTKPSKFTELRSRLPVWL